MLEGDFEDGYFEPQCDVVSRIGLSDVSAFGLTWEDCDGFFRNLGYHARVELEPIAS